MKWLGITITVLYFLFVIIFVYSRLDELANLRLNEMGDFIAGVVGPAALFWLVLGFFLQSRELRNSVDALKLQSEELQESVKQQTRLAKVSEEQHRLDLEKLHRQDKLDFEKTFPNFLIAGDGGSGGKTQRYRFRVTNVGGAASYATVEVIGDVISKRLQDLGQIKKDEERTFEIETEVPRERLPGNLHAKIVGRGSSGRTRIQTFDLSDKTLRQLGDSFSPEATEETEPQGHDTAS